MFTQRIHSRLVWSAVFFCGILAVVLLDPSGANPAPIYGAPPTYTISLTGDNAPTTSDIFTSATQTVRYTQFEYTQAKASPGNHITLSSSNGLLKNSSSSPITSITSVTATFSTTGSLLLCTSFDQSTYASYTLASGVRKDLASLPYYMELWAMGSEVTLESVIITYSCAPHVDNYDTYRVTWYNDDGTTVLEVDEDVARGTMPEYNGPIPTKTPEEGLLYVFAGWDWPLEPVYGEQVYYATYTSVMATFTSLDDTAYVLSEVSDKTITSISVPSSYLGKPVTVLGDSVFADFTSLEQVTLPTTLTSIGYAAFAGCTSLKDIFIPENVYSINNIPFVGCASLTAINVDANNTSYSSLDGVLFNKAQDQLMIYPAGKGTSYAIPSGVTSIADDAFFMCTSLASVTIPDTVTTMGYNTFFGCASLDNVVIPDTVTSLGGGTFLNCLALTTVTIPSGLTSLPYSIFQGCSNLVSVGLPSGLETIEMDAFYGCSSLTSITLPSGVTSIHDRAFLDCLSLTNVVFPAGLTFIGGNAFTNCDSMTAVDLPASVTVIEGLAFSECSSLSTITVDAANTVYASMDGVLFTHDMTTLICYPSGKTDATYTVPSSVTRIVSNAFRNNPYLTSLILPATVSTLDIFGIYLCSNVTLNCVASEKPAGWDSLWNGSSRPVVWGYVA